MNDFLTAKKVFIKSKNSIKKINKIYLLSLIILSIYTIIYNLIISNYSSIISFFKNTIIIYLISLILELLLNIKKKKINNIIKDYHLYEIILILSLFLINKDLITIIISVLITFISKKLIKNIGISSSLFGILSIIIISKYQNNLITPLTNLQSLSYNTSWSNMLFTYQLKDYLFGSYYLNPIISLLLIIFLYYKKVLKYNLTSSYLITFSILFLIHGLINNMNIYFLIFNLLTGNIFIFTIIGLNDFSITPSSRREQIIYGIIIAIISYILRFIIPESSILISILLGNIFLTKPLDNLSDKLKYQNKTYIISLIILLIISIISIIAINTLI